MCCSHLREEFIRFTYRLLNVFRSTSAYLTPGSEVSLWIWWLKDQSFFCLYHCNPSRHIHWLVFTQPVSPWEGGGGGWYCLGVCAACTAVLNLLNYHLCVHGSCCSSRLCWYLQKPRSVCAGCLGCSAGGGAEPDFYFSFSPGDTVCTTCFVPWWTPS